MIIDPAWEGTVQFYELVFGTWLAYGFLTLMWERGLKCRLPEWKYVLITFLGASAYWINHYFQNAPLYWWMLNAYSVVFLVAYYRIAVHTQPRTLPWRIGGHGIGDRFYCRIHSVREYFAFYGQWIRHQRILVYVDRLLRICLHHSLAGPKGADLIRTLSPESPLAMVPTGADHYLSHPIRPRRHDNDPVHDLPFRTFLAPDTQHNGRCGDIDCR
jgi:hypothetical protein